MITPRHHIWGYGGHHYGYYGCGDIEDFVMLPRCCEQYWDMVGFDDVGSCREHYDDIDIRSLLIWEWLMGALFIGAIALTFIICCCWRRGKVINLFIISLTVASSFDIFQPRYQKLRTSRL